MLLLHSVHCFFGVFYSYDDNDNDDDNDDDDDKNNRSYIDLYS